MKLVYKSTGVEVQKGDVVTLRDGATAEIKHFDKPHKPASSGKVSIQRQGSMWTDEYFVGVIGAIWIDREDRA